MAAISSLSHVASGIRKHFANSARKQIGRYDSSKQPTQPCARRISKSGTSRQLLQRNIIAAIGGIANIAKLTRLAQSRRSGDAVSCCPLTKSTRVDGFRPLHLYATVHFRKCCVPLPCTQLLYNINFYYLQTEDLFGIEQHEAIDHAFYCSSRQLFAARDGCCCVSERLRAMRRATPTLLPSKAIKLKWLGVGSGAFIALVIVVVWFAWPRQGKETITAILLETGYLEIVPPTTFGGPGTINTIEFLSNGKVEMHPTCDIEPGFLADKIQKSQTVDRELKQSLEKKLDVSAEIKEKLAAIAGISQISSVHLKLENASVLLITDESLISARHALLKGECEDAVIENVSSGGIVCQTRSVLEADVIYEINYNDTVSIGERAKLTSEAAAKLNLDARQDSDNRISGHQLFFGVKLAPKPILASNSSEVKCTVLKK